jgi:hypothetical protein
MWGDPTRHIPHCDGRSNDALAWRQWAQHMSRDCANDTDAIHRTGYETCHIR